MTKLTKKTDDAPSSTPAPANVPPVTLAVDDVTVPVANPSPSSPES